MAAKTKTKKTPPTLRRFEWVPRESRWGPAGFSLFCRSCGTDRVSVEWTKSRQLEIVCLECGTWDRMPAV